MAPEADNFFSRWSRRKLQEREAAPAAPPPAERAAAQPVPHAVAAGDAGVATPAVGSDTSRADTLVPPVLPEPATPPADRSAAPDASPPPTLEDLAALDHDSSYARFVARDVSPDVRNAAMKKLFADPHYNVMDGLDIYIDDYSKPDPLPAGMLRQMVQSKMLGLFAAEDAADEAAALAARQPPAPAPGEAADPALPATEPGRPELDSVASAPHPAADAATLATAPDEDPSLQLQPDDDAGCAGPDAGAGPHAGRQRGRAG